jgi:SnoaL-like domain
VVAEETGERLAALDAEVAALRAEVRRVDDERALHALMVAYHVACDHPTDKGARVAALFTEDGAWEAVGRWATPGWAAVGRPALVAKFDRNHERMPFALHHLTGGTVAFDPGPQPGSATGEWTYFQSCTHRGTVPLWIAGAYHVGFRRVEGRWLIARMAVENAFTTPFDQGWVAVPHVATP